MDSFFLKVCQHYKSFGVGLKQQVEDSWKTYQRHLSALIVSTLTGLGNILEVLKRYGKPITIEDNCLIAFNATICGGVTIGEGSIIGAGAVVLKSIP